MERGVYRFAPPIARDGRAARPSPHPDLGADGDGEAELPRSRAGASLGLDGLTLGAADGLAVYRNVGGSVRLRPARAGIFTSVPGRPLTSRRGRRRLD